MSFGNCILLLCKTCGAIFYCFLHQNGRLITWMQTKNYRIQGHHREMQMQIIGSFRRTRYITIFNDMEISGPAFYNLARRCYTVKCFVELVPPQCRQKHLQLMLQGKLHEHSTLTVTGLNISVPQGKKIFQ